MTHSLVTTRTRRRIVGTMLALLATAGALRAAESRPTLPRLKVSDNGRFLVTEKGTPFFWLGDTTWNLFQRTSLEDAPNQPAIEKYLAARARQGFTVIQATLVQGIKPNVYGHDPFTNGDSPRPKVGPGPKDDYWDIADRLIELGERHGLYMALLPTWLDSLSDKDPIVRDPQVAYHYGQFLGSRYREKTHLLWVLGGDPWGKGKDVDNPLRLAMTRALAEGIADGVNGVDRQDGQADYSTTLMTFHPKGGHHSSSELLHNEPWLDFNMIQTTTHFSVHNYETVALDYGKTPVKPTLDGEVAYENSLSLRKDEPQDRRITPWDVRRAAYWAVFAGGFGHTYGHRSFIQWTRKGENTGRGGDVPWYEVLDSPGANQMRHLRALMESRSFLSRVPDQSLLINPGKGPEHIQATRGDGYAFIYTPTGRAFTVNLGSLAWERVNSSWFDPRTGETRFLGEFEARQEREFVPPSRGSNNDWVLVLLSIRPGAAVSDFPYRFVPLRDIAVQDEFWTPLLERNRTVTLPHQLRMLERDGSLRNFDRAAGTLAGDPEPLRMSDEVVYKWVEAASYELARRPDTKLAAQVDAVIARIAAAQEPDGYLFTHRTIALRASPSAPLRWSNMRDNELYYAGHLYEAAVAHFEATGKPTLLEVAIKNADLVERLFGLGPGKRRDVCGHSNNEQALVRLARATGRERYLKLAEFFVDERGHANGRPLYGSFAQDHQPLVDQDEAVGQAPRATYLYCGATDLAALLGRDDYRRAMERLWRNVVGAKMYVTGGIGSQHENEGFGAAYDLPNLTAYTEICAAVSFSMWNMRMFQLTGEGQYFDVLERTLYNNFLAGTSHRGDRYFYACPPESDGQFKFNVGWLPREYKGPYREAAATRQEWFACACCPPNYSRWLAQLPHLVYATRGDDLFVNLFVAGEARVSPAGGPMTVRQETRYPWDGKVKLVLVSLGRQPERQQAAEDSGPAWSQGRAFLTLHIRIPGWSRGEPVPSDLYRDVDTSRPLPALRVNSQPVDLNLVQGYAVLRREWQEGDVVELDLPMTIRRIVAHERVQADRGRIALERGPIVYCVEGADHGGRVLDLELADHTQLQAAWRADLLGGAMVLQGRAVRAAGRKREEADLTAIPYYLWSNRGAGEMAVWLRTARSF